MNRDFQNSIQTLPSSLRQWHTGMSAYLDADGHWVMPPRDSYLAAKVKAWREMVPVEPDDDASEITEQPFSPVTEAELSTPQRRQRYFTELAQKEMAWHRLLPSWRTVYDSARSRVGQCDFTNKTLSFSRHLVSRGTPEQMREIILHEIAHALAGPRCGHGLTWRDIARQIGCSGQRCQDMELAPARWTFCCPRGCWSRQCFRRSRISNRAKCRQCGQLCIYKQV